MGLNDGSFSNMFGPVYESRDCVEPCLSAPVDESAVAAGALTNWYDLGS